MRKRLGMGMGIIIVLLLAIIAYHRFPVQTKGVFYGIFPIFSWVPVDQPILFNHIRHQEVAKLTCLFCHRHSEKHRSATLPNINLCRTCHATDALSKKSEALKVVKYIQEGKEIPWRRMYELPKFVVFPHWIHVQSGIDCSICHGLTGKKERPVKMVDRNYMEWCMDCHQKEKVNNDCYGCHSS